jgi:Tol biopolymer transport system component
MYTGRQPFQGDTVAEVMAHVIARDPDLSALPANLNPRVPELLRRCLQKDPKRRWHAVADTRVEIEVILADPRGIIIDAELIAPRPLWKRAFPLVAGLLAGAVAGVSAVWLLRAAPAADVTQFRFPLPAGQTFTNTGRPVLTMSRDGTAFVYAGSGRLYLKKMNEFEAKAIPGSEIAGGGPINPAFDATGRSIAFFSEADKTIKRIGVDGGRPVTICRAENVFGMNWGADDSILFGGGSQGVMRVSAKGGSAESILTVKENEQARNPQLLPGGAVLFTLVSGDKTDIVAETPQGNDRKVVIEGGNDARYVPLGRLVYALAGDVLSLPFDVKKLERTDGPTPLPQTVYAGGSKDAAQWSFSDTGSLVYVSKSSTSIQTTVAFVDRDGKTQPIALPPSQYEGPRLSPNGRQLAIGGYDGAERHIWVYDLAGGSAIRQLTLEGEGPSNRFPLWAGEDRVIFQSNRTGVNKVFLQRADGSGPAERVIENSQNQRPTSFNRQNQLVAYIRILNSNRDDDLWTYAISTRKAAEFYAAPGRQQGPAFSPDGRWMVYDSNETGKTEVYVQPYPTGAKVRLTRDGGSHAVWSRDGGEIYFVNAGTLFSMKIRTQPSVTFTSPVPLPISGFVQGDEPSHRNYDFASDGRFIMVFPPGTTEVKGSGPPPQIQAVLNWFEELKQLGADR